MAKRGGIPALLKESHQRRFESLTSRRGHLVDLLVLVHVRAIDYLEFEVASHVGVEQELHKVA